MLDPGMSRQVPVSCSNADLDDRCVTESSEQVVQCQRLRQAGRAGNNPTRDSDRPFQASRVNTAPPGGTPAGDGCSRRHGRIHSAILERATMNTARPKRPQSSRRSAPAFTSSVVT